MSSVSETLKGVIARSPDCGHDGHKEPGPVPCSPPGTQQFWMQCSSCSACNSIVLSQPSPEGVWRLEETKEHLSHFPTSISVDQRSEWNWFLSKPKVAQLPNAALLAGALWMALTLVACWGMGPKKGQDNIACLKVLLQKHSVQLAVFYLQASYFPPQQSGAPYWQPLATYKFT